MRGDMHLQFHYRHPREPVRQAVSRNTPGSEGWPQLRQELKMRLLTLRREGDPLGVVETLRDVRKLPSLRASGPAGSTADVMSVAVRVRRVP
ncbi:hypothetical protein CHLRE_01g033532v5 [Chlamydomonas reinhardtii]|uniref:Uncharacterized protein n=1 Tax=Chlamydomonas reinhardtii TaxID=3055 RepID=A0A2K3E6V8_CHLRE|nr:uncharacterized protein CHLRE_01g033532v5 [Chlamydomonas reinhardtii]PNW88535.1 hypothetical protein CHLRE_01g033532v5 [Chlamydomonas reinhardtii]